MTTEVNQENVIKALGDMTVQELCDLTKFLEQKWGVEAKPVAAEFGTTKMVEVEKVEQTEFEVVLVSFPADKKITLVKLVREVLGLGLLESKGVVESTLPKSIKDGMSKDDAAALKVKMNEAGAVVEIK
jgi:large subunit ribosomal protein L7/L12